MDMETALLHQFLLFAHPDIPVMEMEIVSQLHQALLLLKYVQVEKLAMETEIVSQFQSQLAVQMDGNLTDKEDVFH